MYGPEYEPETGPKCLFFNNCGQKDEFPGNFIFQAEKLEPRQFTDLTDDYSIHNPMITINPVVSPTYKTTIKIDLSKPMDDI